MIASFVTALFLLGVMTAPSASGFLYITGGLLILMEIITFSTFGILAFNGGLSVLVGYMIASHAQSLWGLPVGWPFFFGIAFVEAAAVVICVIVVLRGRVRRITTGLESMIGEAAAVLQWNKTKGRVRIHGEDWKAVSDDTVKAGDTVIVETIEHLTLHVSKQASKGD